MHPMLNIGVRAARKAGNFIAKTFENSEDIQVTAKGSNDIVTNIDTEAEALIIDIIRQAYPEHNIVGEESGLVQGKDADYQWIIDPLDGSTNFVSGFPHFAVSIALRIKNRTELAIVYDPIRNELFTAERGRGAKLNNQRLRTSKATELNGTIVGAGFPYKQRQHLPAFQGIFAEMFVQVSDVRRSGCAALDLCYVAASRLDAYFGVGLKPWDMAAAELIARESGALCTDFAAGSNYMASGNLVVANPRIIKPMLSVIRENGTESILK